MLPSLILVLLSLLGSPPDERPNILFIMSDDHAWQAISQYGADRNTTPNIDRIGREGLVFDRHFVENSICAPSRAAILTGTFSHLHGVPTNAEKFDGTQPTFPALAQEAGYQTALIGKWHLKSEPIGFDHYQRLIGQGLYYGSPMIRNGERIETEGYITDLITELSVDWLENQRDPAKPFILMVQHKAPHRNWMPGAAHIDDLVDSDLPEPDTLFDDYAGRGSASTMQEMTIRDHLSKADLKLEMPEWMMRMTEEERATWDAAYQPRNEAFEAMDLEGDDLIRWKYQRYAKDYLRCIASVDDSVGKLLDAIEELDLAEDTVVIYTSDQGWYLGEHGWYDKRWMYEESFRTPFIVRWPDRIDGGTTSDLLAQNIDLAPTLLDLAGVDAPARMHGESFADHLRSGGRETPADWRDAVYYRYYESNGPHTVPKHDGVRTDRWKLIRFPEVDPDGDGPAGPGCWELYDLEADPDELKSLADDPAHAEIRAGLEVRLKELRRRYDA